MIHKSFSSTIENITKDSYKFYRNTRGPLLFFGVVFTILCISFQVNVHSEQDVQRAVTQSRRTAIVHAVQRASPAVVNISATRSVKQPTSLEEWLFWDAPRLRERSLREVGSGVIINPEGYILTNHHVIEEAEKINIAIADGREFDAQIIGYDYLSDLALLKIETREDLPEIQWGDSDNLLIGEWALAIGNPFGLSIGNAQPTVTIGIVSATQRSLTVDNRFHEALIQTDASVNPGNSGGALVNVHGQLIGINTVIRSTSGGSQGVGFAIPANKAKKVLQNITNYGSVVPPYIGVEVQSVTEDMAEKLLGFATDSPKSTAHSSGVLGRREASQKSHVPRGVLISELDKQSPIADAGIKRGDIIWSISGHRVKDEYDFKAVVRLLPIKQNIKCQYIRRGKKRETNLMLKTLEWNYMPRGWGLTLTQPNKEQIRKNKRRGVVISHIERESGLADSLKKGDIIFRINDMDIHSLEVFKIVDERIRNVDQRFRYRNRIQLHFERNGQPAQIPIAFNSNNR